MCSTQLQQHVSDWKLQSITGRTLKLDVRHKEKIWLCSLLKNLLPGSETLLGTKLLQVYTMKQLTLSIIFHRFYYANVSSYVLTTKNATSYLLTYKIEAQ